MTSKEEYQIPSLESRFFFLAENYVRLLAVNSNIHGAYENAKFAVLQIRYSLCIHSSLSEEEREYLLSQKGKDELDNTISSFVKKVQQNRCFHIPIPLVRLFKQYFKKSIRIESSNKSPTYKRARIINMEYKEYMIPLGGIIYEILYYNPEYNNNNNIERKNSPLISANVKVNNSLFDTKSNKDDSNKKTDDTIDELLRLSKVKKVSEETKVPTSTRHFKKIKEIEIKPLYSDIPNKQVYNALMGKITNDLNEVVKDGNNSLEEFLVIVEPFLESKPYLIDDIIDIFDSLNSIWKKDDPLNTILFGVGAAKRVDAFIRLTMKAEYKIDEIINCSNLEISSLCEEYNLDYEKYRIHKKKGDHTSSSSTAQLIFNSLNSKESKDDFMKEVMKTFSLKDLKENKDKIKKLLSYNIKDASIITKNLLNILFVDFSSKGKKFTQEEMKWFQELLDEFIQLVSSRNKNTSIQGKSKKENELNEKDEDDEIFLTRSTKEFNASRNTIFSGWMIFAFFLLILSTFNGCMASNVDKDVATNASGVQSIMLKEGGSFISELNNMYVDYPLNQGEYNDYVTSLSSEEHSPTQIVKGNHIDTNSIELVKFTNVNPISSLTEKRNEQHSKSQEDKLFDASEIQNYTSNVISALNIPTLVEQKIWDETIFRSLQDLNPYGNTTPIPSDAIASNKSDTSYLNVWIRQYNNVISSAKSIVNIKNEELSRAMKIEGDKFKKVKDNYDNVINVDALEKLINTKSAYIYDHDHVIGRQTNIQFDIVNNVANNLHYSGVSQKYHEYVKNSKLISSFISDELHQDPFGLMKNTKEETLQLLVDRHHPNDIQRLYNEQKKLNSAAVVSIPEFQDTYMSLQQRRPHNNLFKEEDQLIITAVILSEFRNVFKDNFQSIIKEKDFMDVVSESIEFYSQTRKTLNTVQDVVFNLIDDGFQKLNKDINQTFHDAKKDVIEWIEAHDSVLLRIKEQQIAVEKLNSVISNVTSIHAVLDAVQGTTSNLYKYQLLNWNIDEKCDILNPFCSITKDTFMGSYQHLFIWNWWFRQISAAIDGIRRMSNFRDISFHTHISEYTVQIISLIPSLLSINYTKRIARELLRLIPKIAKVRSNRTKNTSNHDIEYERFVQISNYTNLRKSKQEFNHKKEGESNPSFISKFLTLFDPPQKGEEEGKTLYLGRLAFNISRNIFFGLHIFNFLTTVAHYPVYGLSLVYDWDGHWKYPVLLAISSISVYPLIKVYNKLVSINRTNELSESPIVNTNAKAKRIVLVESMLHQYERLNRTLKWVENIDIAGSLLNHIPASYFRISDLSMEKKEDNISYSLLRIVAIVCEATILNIASEDYIIPFLTKIFANGPIDIDWLYQGLNIEENKTPNSIGNLLRLFFGDRKGLNLKKSLDDTYLLNNMRTKMLVTTLKNSGIADYIENGSTNINFTSSFIDVNSMGIAETDLVSLSNNQLNTLQTIINVMKDYKTIFDKAMGNAKLPKKTFTFSEFMQFVENINKK